MAADAALLGERDELTVPHARLRVVRKSEILRTAIEERRAVVVPGCHDALSARVVETCGFEAVQVSGFGLAASLLAAPDVGLVHIYPRNGSLESTREPARCASRSGPVAVSLAGCGRVG